MGIIMQVLSRYGDINIGELLGLSRTADAQEEKTETYQEVSDTDLDLDLDLDLIKELDLSQEETQAKKSDENESRQAFKDTTVTKQSDLSDKRKTEEDH